jgi:hypothetical protein
MENKCCIENLETKQSNFSATCTDWENQISRGFLKFSTFENIFDLDAPLDPQMEELLEQWKRIKFSTEKSRMTVPS